MLKVKKTTLGTVIHFVLTGCGLDHEVKDGVFRFKMAPPPPPEPKNPLVDAALAAVDSATVERLSGPRITLEVDRVTLAETLVLLRDITSVWIELDPSVDGEAKWGGEGTALTPSEVLAAICEKHGLVVKLRGKRIVLGPAKVDTEAARSGPHR